MMKTRETRALVVCFSYFLILGVASLTTVGFAQDKTGGLPPGVVAEQGGVQVTLKDIDAYAAQIPEKDRAGFFDSPKRIQSTIMNLLLKKQLTVQARAAGLDKDAGVQRQIQSAIEDTLARVQLQHFRATLKKPDFSELAQEYYRAHMDEFVTRGEVNVKHVLVSDKDRTDAEAKARIDKVEAEARAHPEQFDELVKQYSDDPSKADNHGLIKDAASSRMAEPFAKAAAALKKPGQISPIVKTQFGYHVLKLVSRQPDHQKAYAEVRDELILKLKNNWVDTQVTEYTGHLRGQPLKADPELVASLRTRYLKQGQMSPEEAIENAEQKKSGSSANKSN